MNTNVSTSKAKITIPVLIGGMVGAAAVSVLSAFLFDPVMGKRRRQDLAEKLANLGKGMADRADHFTRRAVDQAKNFVAEAEDILRPDADETLVDSSESSTMNPSMNSMNPPMSSPLNSSMNASSSSFSSDGSYSSGYSKDDLHS